MSHKEVQRGNMLRKAAENASSAACGRTFVTKFPLLIGGAALLSLLWNGSIRWGAVSGGSFMVCAMLAQFACLAWFAAILGYQSLRHRHWIFAFFCLGPLIVLANVALICAGRGMTTLHQGDASTWVLVTLILISIPLGLMIDTGSLSRGETGTMSRASALIITVGAILMSTVCSFSNFGEREAGKGRALVVQIFRWYHTGVW